MSRFTIGDTINCEDARRRHDCYSRVLINVILPGIKQYHGICLGVIEKGKEVKDDPRTGMTIAVPMEGSLKRDWNERLTLVKETKNEGVDSEYAGRGNC